MKRDSKTIIVWNMAWFLGKDPAKNVPGSSGPVADTLRKLEQNNKIWPKQKRNTNKN